MTVVNHKQKQYRKQNGELGKIDSSLFSTLEDFFSIDFRGLMHMRSYDDVGIVGAILLASPNELVCIT